jgi:hypothetical protein
MPRMGQPSYWRGDSAVESFDGATTGEGGRLKRKWRELERCGVLEFSLRTTIG